MKKVAVNNTVYRESYLPFPWTLNQVKLRFEIGDESTRVVSEFCCFCQGILAASRETLKGAERARSR